MDSFRESERTISDGFELANLPASQLKLAMSQTASAEALVEERRGQKKLAIRQLQILLGKYPSGGHRVPGQIRFAAEDAAGWASIRSIHRRADMIAAERRAAAADKRIREAELALLPQIRPYRQGWDSQRDPAQLDQSGQCHLVDRWWISARRCWPVERSRPTSPSAKRLLNESIANYQRTALIAFTEVENALTAEDLLRRRETALVR